MATAPFRLHALVLYKSEPALVKAVADKIEILLPGGETQRVRPKDIALLHPGPCESLTDLKPLAAEAAEAWEILQGQTVPLAELSELLYGSHTPSAAWSAWQLVREGLYFGGEPGAVHARSADEIAQHKAAADEAAAEKKAWEAFLARVKEGRVAPEDRPFLGEVEAVALGRTQKSRLLKELGTNPTPENAHALLLRLGHWTPSVNPHPGRDGMPTRAPEVALADDPGDARRDLTHLAAFAIDDEGNTDPDDAVSLDGDVLWVHVADVASLVPPDSPADLEARGMGANLYLPERVVPMLPPAATERLGLGLAPISPALSFGIRLADDGSLAAVEVVLSRVKVTRLSYDEVEKRLDEPVFAELHARALRFQRRRLARGSMRLDFPEVKLKVEDGEIRIKPLPRLRSRELVTESMLMAGEAAAKFAMEHRIPFPFTTQVAPEPGPEPKDLAAMFAFRKRLKPSQNKTAPEPHSGLGLDAYARATSPLRRYLDLVVHQQLRAHLTGRQVLGPQPVLSRVGAAEAVLGGIRRVERSSNQHWTLVWLMRRPDWTGKAILVDKHGSRGTVIVPELGFETRVNLAGEPALNTEITLVKPLVDLARLSVHFMMKG